MQKGIVDIPNQLDKGKKKPVHFPVQNQIIMVTSDFKGIYLPASDSEGGGGRAQVLGWGRTQLHSPGQDGSSRGVCLGRARVRALTRPALAGSAPGRALKLFCQMPRGKRSEILPMRCLALETWINI